MFLTPTTRDLYQFIPIYAVQRERRSRYIYPVTLDKKDRDALRFISDKLDSSNADAIREAINHFSEYLQGIEVVRPRKISNVQATKEIVEYLRGKERVYTDEIVDALNIDFDKVNRILMDLWQRRKVEQIE